MDREQHDRDIVEEASEALRRSAVPEGPPAALVQATLRAVEQTATGRRPAGWKERMLGMFSRDGRRAGGAGFWSLRRFGVLTGVLAAVNAAGLIWIHHDLVRAPRQKLRVLSAWPTEGEVDRAERFVLTFDEPLAAAEAVGQPADRSPFALSPPVPGQWRWAAPDRLEFVLAQPLPPGRQFVIRPAAQFELLTGRQVVGPAEFRFRTRPLQLERCQLDSADRQQVNVLLEFNQPVLPQDLLKHVELRDARSGSRLAATCLVQEPSQRLVLRSDRPGQGANLRVRLGAGLTGAGGELGLAQDSTQELAVPARFTMLRTEVDVAPLRARVTVRLLFSEELDRGQPVPAVSVSPPVDDLRVTRYDRELALMGPFECGRRYTATVGPSVLSAGGQTLGEEQTLSFDVPDRRPRVRFPADQGILSSRGSLLVDLEAVNAPKVWVDAWRLHSNNLVAYLHDPCETPTTSRQLGRRTLELGGPRNVPQKAAMDLRSVMDQPVGVYRLQAGMESQPHWHSDSAIVAVTDLGITVKRHRLGYLVWVTSLRTAEPVAGARVSAITRNNQTIASAVTGEDGVAVLAASFNHPDGPAWVVTAEKDGDLSFLLPESREWPMEDADVSGRSRPATYEVMLYGDRGVYRPGETVHLTGLVRQGDGTIPPPFPLSLAVIRPDGRKVADIPVSPEAGGQGMFHADYTPPADGQTGVYQFAATLPGATERLGSLAVQVEAFVPVRIEVKASPAKERFEANEPVQVQVSGRYLFDQPAAELPVVVRGTYQPARYLSKAHKDYQFGPTAPEGAGRDVQAEGTTDAGGRATVSLEGPPPARRGLYAARVAATITEPGGRSVSANLGFRVDRIGRHVGLRAPAGRIVPVDRPVAIGWVRVDGEDRPLDGNDLDYELCRLDWDWVVERVNGRPVWKSHERTVAVQSGSVMSTGPRGELEVRCPQAGRYRLRLVERDSGSEAVAEFYAAFADQAAASVQQPERLEVVLDSDTYLPGEVAKVLVRSPFAGTVLLTVETDRVIDRQVMATDGQTAELELPVPFGLRGGAFVVATVVRAVDPEREQWLPVRAMGLARLAMDPSAGRLPLAIEVSGPAKAQPGQKVSLRVRASGAQDPARPPRVHLWAVDEGILLTSAYRTPDPAGFFLCPRALEVTSSDLFGDLMPDYKRPADIRRIGADGDPDDDDHPRAIRLSPVPIRTLEAAVIWNRAAPAGPDGTASFEMELPEFTGELRLMAVGVDHDRYGWAQQALTVASPLLAEASWPRFAAPGDRFAVPVKVFNNTGASLSARVLLAIDGPVRARLASGGGAVAPAPADLSELLPPDGAGELTRLDLLPGESRTIWLDAQADATGQVGAEIIAMAVQPDAQPLISRHKARFTVRPVAPLHSQVRLLKLLAGEKVALSAPEDLEPNTARTVVDVSGRPDVQLRPAVEQLLDYPYGCVEQTTSRLYGILYAPDLLLADSPQDARVRAAGGMIRSGIARLWSMQTRSGGMAFWPGGRDSDLWPSAYVGAFLAQARRAGYLIDPGFTDGLMKYLADRLNQPDDSTNWNTRALICHVLAAFDRPQPGWMNRLAERPDQLDIAGRAHLAQAYARIGRKDLAMQVLPDDTMNLAVVRSTGGRITSRVAQQAVLLEAMLDIAPEHPWVPALVQGLEKARAAQGHWGTTLENASALAALARYQTLHRGKSEFSGRLTMPGGTAHPFAHDKPLHLAFADDGRPAEITTEGAGPVYLTIRTEGLLRDGRYERYDRQLQVRRAWKDLSGRPVDPNSIRVGDLIVAEIYFRAPELAGGTHIANLAIVDALPGGVEVENTRLATSVQQQAARAVPVPTTAPGTAPGRELTDEFLAAETASPDRVEWLDDRVVVFASVTRQARVYRYLLRATCSGEFALPPIQASCMYDPSVASLHGGGVVKVSK